MILPGLRHGAATIGAATILAMLAAVFAAAPARAQTQDLFTVSGIDVDVTAESAAAARESALAQGQREAFERLLLRLALAEDLAGMPRLSDAEITQMVQDFQVESERSSSVRYIGDLTFRFRADPVRRLLGRHGVRFAAITSKPVLLLPVFTTEAGVSELWGDPNPWREAWAARPGADGLVPFVVPLGDLGDLAAIDTEEALAGDAATLAALPDRYGTGDTIVAEARIADAGEDRLRLDIDAKRYADGTVQENYSDSVTGPAAEREALFAGGVERLDEMVQEAWKRANLVSFGAEQTLIATVPVGRLSDWVAVRDRLADIAIVRDAEILYLMRDEGRLRLSFAGDVTQLSRALAQEDLSLSPAPDESWVLRLGPEPASGPADASPPAAVN